MRVVYIVIARILATFDILPPVDENGKARMPREDFTDDLVRYAGCHTLPPRWHQNRGISSDVCRPFDRHPMPFECIVKPRSVKSTTLVRELLEKS